MFITVLFGAGCWELVNPWCSLVTLAAHLRRRGRAPPDATVALLAEDGHLVSLGESPEAGTSQPPSTGRPLLRERETYVLVQVIKGEGGGPTRYVSLLDNLDDQCPELAEQLRWLSGLPPTRDSRRRRRQGTQHGSRDRGPFPGAASGGRPSRAARTGPGARVLEQLEAKTKNRGSVTRTKL